MRVGLLLLLWWSALALAYPSDAFATDDCSALVPFVSVDTNIALALNWTTVEPNWCCAHAPLIVCAPEPPNRVVAIDLYDRGIQGRLGHSLRLLTALQRLDLGANALTGNLQPLATLTHLQRLDLRINALTGDLQPLSTLIALQELLLSNNALTGELQPLATLTQLQVLDLFNNALTGDLQPLATPPISNSCF